MALYAEFFSLSHGLRRYRKWGKDQYRLVGFPRYVLGPHKLLWGFAKATILKQRGASLADSPLDKGLLKVKKEIRHPHRFKSSVRAALLFLLKIFGVCHLS
jgi:hypothetical protein